MSDQRERAIWLMQQQRFSEALPIFLRLTESDANDWSLYYMAGQCLRFINNIPEAVRFLTKAASLNPDRQSEAQILLALGIALQLAEEYELAIKKLEQAVRLEPKLFSAYNSIGLTYRKVGQFRKALEWYSKAAESIVAAICDEVRNDSEKCFKEGIVDGKKVLIVLPDALEKIHEMLRSDQIYAIVKNNIGVCLMELGDIGSAREQFRESIEFIPEGYNYPDPFKHLEAIG
jgi:tetratricopeptide (TPR) repeat protein